MMQFTKQVAMATCFVGSAFMMYEALGTSAENYSAQIEKLSVHDAEYTEILDSKTDKLTQESARLVIGSFMLAGAGVSFGLRLNDERLRRLYSEAAVDFSAFADSTSDEVNKYLGIHRQLMNQLNETGQFVYENSKTESSPHIINPT